MQQLVEPISDLSKAQDTFPVALDRERADPLGNPSRRVLAVLLLDCQRFGPTLLIVRQVRVGNTGPRTVMRSAG